MMPAIDAIAVRQFDPSDTSVEELLGRIQALSDTVKTIEQVEQYHNQQPQPPAEISFDQAFDRVQDLQMSYIRIPPVFLEKMKTEIDPVSYWRTAISDSNPPVVLVVIYVSWFLKFTHKITSNKIAFQPST